MIPPRLDKSLTIDDLRESVATMLDVDAASIDDEANLSALGIDSLRMIRLANRFRRAGLRVSYGQLVSDPTLAAWKRCLDDVQAAGR
jgi:yersiniabactin nonribosomal peptide synthetase